MGIMQVRAGSRSEVQQIMTSETKTAPALSTANTRDPSLNRYLEWPFSKAGALHPPRGLLQGGQFSLNALRFPGIFARSQLAPLLEEHMLTNERTGPSPSRDCFWSTVPDTAERQ